MSKSKNIFITGCNRPNGIGFGLVKQMLDRYNPEHLFATCRNPADAKELNELAANYGNLHVIELDTVDTEKFGDVVSQVDKVTGGEGINLLINNAAILEQPQSSIHQLNKDLFMKHLEVNTVAPILLTKAFLPLLEKAAANSNSPSGIQKAAIVNISTKVASIADNTGGGMYLYRSSKTALNMATKCLSLELKNKGIVTLMLHPGWVQTDLGGPNGTLTTEQSVTEMTTVIEKLGADDNGKFFNYDGQEIPW
ncbi:C-factor-like [Folsomia candida]|uniref:C-factor-like n=1 Tax=Folsomia candida TaxID=158441 RepID=UPI001604D237|nr:C-factor-like [Folsomia candida]